MPSVYPTIRTEQVADLDRFNVRMAMLDKRLVRFIEFRFEAAGEHLDDLVQAARIRLGQVYQEQPWIMDYSDGAWVSIGKYGAYAEWSRLLRQKGSVTTHADGSMKVIQRLFSECDFGQAAQCDMALESIEIAATRSCGLSRPVENEIERSLYVQTLIEKIITAVQPHRKQEMRQLMLALAEGYPFRDIPAHCGWSASKSVRNLRLLRDTAHDVMGLPRPKRTGLDATPEEIELMHKLLEKGYTGVSVAKQINRSEYFVSTYRSTRGKCPADHKFTPPEIKQAQQMRSEGYKAGEIAKQLGRSQGALYKILKKHDTLKS